MSLPSFSTQSHLLEPGVLVDAPELIYKSSGELLRENALWLIGTGLILFLSLLVLRFMRSRKAPSPGPGQSQSEISPHEEAVRALEELESATPMPSPKNFVYRLSQILRAYLKAKFRLSALEQTGEEFIREITSSPLLKEVINELNLPLREFVRQGDLIKYSKNTCTRQDLDGLLTTAKRFLSLAEMTSSAKAPTTDSTAYSTQARND